MSINASDVQFYRDNGYLVVPNVLRPQQLQDLRTDLEDIVSKAAQVVENDSTYDLESTHTRQHPRVRRIKLPHRVMPSVKALMRDPALVNILTALMGPGVRFQTSKLNLKSAGYGAAVEWHQDWAFYPHTNDNLLAAGIMLSDVDENNGPMQVIPGSHKGPVLNHHADGYFCGAIDPTQCDVDFGNAVPLTGPAGSITFHHVRAIHGSALNRSSNPRHFLLYQFTAVDAWPLTENIDDIAAYDRMIVAGEPTLEPRLEQAPVRLPLPPAPSQGSIYENQKSLSNRYFEVEDDRTSTHS